MTNKKSMYKIDRRSLLKYSAAGVAGIALLDLDAMAGSGVCQKYEDLGTNTINPQGAIAAIPEFFYWIDGPFTAALGASQPVITRARLSLFIDVPHTSSSFVESVVLLDGNKKFVSLRNFESGDGTSNGRAPYVIFDGITLDPSLSYTVFYTINDGANVKVYVYEIAKENVRPSRFDFSHLGSAARALVTSQFTNEISSANHVMESNTSQYGLVTTPFQHFGDAGLDIHFCRARIHEINTSGQFTFQVAAMHTDVSALHYQRYFGVLDPVGRVLGLTRRAFSGAVNAGWVTINRGINACCGAYTMASGEADRINGVNIIDCPHVMVVTDDIQHALARVSLRLK